MPTLFHQRFEDRVEPANVRAFGVSVQLRNGADLSDAFNATFDLQEYESVGFEVGLAIKVKYRDYFIAVADCVIDDVAIVPEAGMFIVEDGVDREILPLGSDRPAVELDEGGYRYLVHTKEVTP